MKRLFLLAFLILLPVLYASSQVVTERCWHLDKLQFLDQRQDFWRSHKIFTTASHSYTGIGSGMYSITEIQYGFGLFIVDYPFSHHVAGATSALGWRFGNGFAIGGGTGFLKYNGGYKIGRAHV